MISGQFIGKDSEVSGHFKFEILPRNLSGGTEEYRESPKPG
jgi:hypothetical protein